MSVRDNTSQHETAPEVEQFLANAPEVKQYRVPDKPCPVCHSPLLAVGIYIIEDQPAIWHLICPVAAHSNDYAVVMDSS